MSIFSNKRVSLVEQLQQTECGLCCASMILKYYGSHQTLATLREYLDVGRDGLTMLQLKKLIGDNGFDVRVFKGNCHGLKEIKLPAIIFWKNDHYVVLEEIKKNGAIIVDPAFGRRKVSKDSLEDNFAGYVLEAIPNNQFVKVKKNRSVWIELFSEIVFDKKLFGKVIVLSLVTYLITIGIPLVVQFLIDEVAMKNQNNILGVAFAVMVILTVVFGLMYFYRGGKELISLQVLLDKSMMKKNISSSS